MHAQTKTTRWLTLLLSTAIVVGGGAILLISSPLGSQLVSSHRLGGSPPDSGPNPSAAHHPESISQSMNDCDVRFLDAQSPSTEDEHWARYDNIVVEVGPDGTLNVLGELMEMEAFRTFLGYQLEQQLRTMVTIRPDNECLFRHVGPVISACNDIGVPHQMESRPTTVPAIIGIPGA